MVHRAVIGDDGRGPVAEATTRERCNALYPGSNPGRASSLRWLRQLRLGKPAKRASLILLSLPKTGLPRRTSKSEGGSSKSEGGFNGHEPPRTRQAVAGPHRGKRI